MSSHAGGSRAIASRRDSRRRALQSAQSHGSALRSLRPGRWTLGVVQSARDAMTLTSGARASRLRVLFFVEGFTDIRFVIGLCEICDLTMVVPERQYLESGLKGRIESASCRIDVITVPGGRPAFQSRSILRLWSLAPRFDVILAQEVLRGALNANLVGTIRRVPVVTYMCASPMEYFRCRRERGQISAPVSLFGQSVIWGLMTLNGKLATQCVAMGRYLAEVAGKYCSTVSVGLYY